MAEREEAGGARQGLWFVPQSAHGMQNSHLLPQEGLWGSPGLSGIPASLGVLVPLPSPGGWAGGSRVPVPSVGISTAQVLSPSLRGPC